MQKKFSLLILALLAICIIACDRPECSNENEIFEQNSPNSKIYKDELVRQLKKIDQSQLRYWLQQYEEVNEKESLYFYVQGAGLCAVVQLDMKQWTRLQDLRAKKGVTYRGAEFTNLQFEIRQDSLTTTFNYIDFDRLID